MYFQEDTVLRMIEQLGAFYRQLMRLFNDHEAETELDEMMRRMAGIDRLTAKGLSIATLADMLTPERRLALADLMLMGTQRFANSMDEAEALAEKHRVLMLLCTIGDEEIAKLRAQRVRELLDECAELCSAADTVQVLRFLLLGGAYADAEDVLFLQLGSYGRPEDMQALLDEGAALYNGLLRLTDAQLASGNLPREEVLQGQAALADWQPGGTS